MIATSLLTQLVLFSINSEKQSMTLEASLHLVSVELGEIGLLYEVWCVFINFDSFYSCCNRILIQEKFLLPY